jgi:hypothetical protein
MSVLFRFVSHGTPAPDPVPPGTVWLDVGDRLSVGAIDHHGTPTDAGTAATAFSRRGDLLAPHLAAATLREVVTHRRPDLDAVAAAWVTVRMAERALPDAAAVAALVAAVDRHDQGHRLSERPEDDWSVVMRLAMAGPDGDDGLVRRGLSLMDRTASVLARGGDLTAAAQMIADADLRTRIARAGEAYAADRSAGVRVRQTVPATSGGVRMVDALHLLSPSSELFKEFARTDRAGSDDGRGFALLLVSWPARKGPGGRPRWRHVASVDPTSGLHLSGLGAALEAAETAAEDRSGAPLPPGRERVPPGTGRNGAATLSPWYDGRGHGFGIVDCPSVTIDGTPSLSSLLTPDEFRAIVSDVGRADG